MRMSKAQLYEITIAPTGDAGMPASNRPMRVYAVSNEDAFNMAQKLHREAAVPAGLAGGFYVSVKQVGEAEHEFITAEIHD